MAFKYFIVVVADRHMDMLVNKARHDGTVFHLDDLCIRGNLVRLLAAYGSDFISGNFHNAMFNGSVSVSIDYSTF